ncbi:MAG: ABC transporter ATP-binding protein [Candidatus Heimdallarchaeota archaeon]|nr:ABC transporter ATP-binding protein [Candidatus Heimdallarchaeota archaeon]
MDVLHASNIHKQYGKNKIALDGANLNLRQGEILGLLGPNGAGKTTLIKILATLLNKDSGQVEILGYDLDTSSNTIRHFLGYVGQDTERSAYARLTPRENLRFFGALRGIGKDEVDDKIAQFGDRFSFNGIMDKQFMHLSGGQKQAVVIMRSLLHDPPIIFLDEPTKGLDPFAAGNIRSFLKEYVLHEKKSVILTSHILPEVDELADRCSLINKGSIGITDTPRALKNAVGVTDFVELVRDDVPSQTMNRIRNLDCVSAFNEREEKEHTWYSFGVSDLFEGAEKIIQVLRADKVKAGFRQRSITLEDAFMHHIGAAFVDEVKQ